MSRVQSIARAFDVLGALAEGPGGVTEIADRVRLPKSTVARMLTSFAQEGAVEQIPGDTRYRLGPRLGPLAPGARPTRRPLAGAHPHHPLVGHLRRAVHALIRSGSPPDPHVSQTGIPK